MSKEQTRPENLDYYKNLMAEAGYAEEKEERTAATAPLEVAVHIEYPPLSHLQSSVTTTEKGRTRRPIGKSVSRENAPVYLALLGLLAVGIGVTTHGVGLGAFHVILQEIHHHGVTQATLHALQSSSAVKQVEIGLATATGSSAAMVVTRNFEE